MLQGPLPTCSPTISNTWGICQGTAGDSTKGTENMHPLSIQWT